MIDQRPGVPQIGSEMPCLLKLFNELRHGCPGMLILLPVALSRAASPSCLIACGTPPTLTSEFFQ